MKLGYKICLVMRAINGLDDLSSTVITFFIY
jgi:hypothetical protein